MVTVENVLDIVPALGVIVALVYYSVTLRYTSKARQRELVFQRFQGYSLEYTRAFAHVLTYDDREDAEDWNKKYGTRANPEAWSEYVYITRIYNLAGILLKEKVADANLIFQLYPPMSVIRIWERFEPVTLGVREQRKVRTFYESFEYLYNEAKKRYPDIIIPDIPR